MRAMTATSLNGALLAIALALLGSAPGFANSAADSAVRQSLKRLAEAWNTSRAAAWADEYWPEGELINIRGDVLLGPAQVRDQTAKILAGPFKDSHFTYTLRSLRYIGSDVAIADMDILVAGFQGLPPGITVTSPGELRTRMKHVYERRGELWRIIASQNTAILPNAALPLK
jgi:uncharacterized protein (TIGR02246 family)